MSLGFFRGSFWVYFRDFSVIFVSEVVVRLQTRCVVVWEGKHSHSAWRACDENIIDIMVLVSSSCFEIM